MTKKIHDLSNRINSLDRSNTKQSSISDGSEESDDQIQVEVGTPFEDFLNENPQRRALSKKEQFAAYRNWRSEKGLNWHRQQP